jgi:hypothetical protein
MGDKVAGLVSVALIICALNAAPARAQPTGPLVTDASLRVISNCLSAAIAAREVSKEAGTIKFICRNDTAQEFFDLLGAYGYSDSTEDIPRSGTFIFRYVTSASNGQPASGSNGQLASRCFHMISDATGKARTAFGCQLYLPVGTLLFH